jgi:DNA polymerase-3 subunit gamma/tau
MEQTLYRKYRSDNFAELAGQEHIKKLFGASLSEEKFAHAYIFAGPRGTGKTTVARIVAKRLNCLNPKDSEPCNECEQCLAIKNGSHLDVIEMDAASNRGIDDFRAIRDKVAYKPAQGKYKVYIIDEVHMLTNEAFNAILKTLEEPPEHAVFILATTNPEKIPDTILSRCQIIPFRNITLETIRNHIGKISELEGYDIDQDVLMYISKRAKGGMRDAMVLLEQIMRFLPIDKKITKSEVLDVLGGVDEERFTHFISLLSLDDVEGIINFSESLYNNGINFEVFLEGLTEFILDTLFEVETPVLKKFYLKIAKKASDMSKEIRYSETPNILFTVEFVDFADNHADCKTEVEQNEKKPDQNKKNRINSDDQKVAIPKERIETNQIGREEFNEDDFSELFDTDADLYTALNLLQTEKKEGTFFIWKDNSRPFSNLVLENKQAVLNDYLKKASLNLNIKTEAVSQPESEKEEIPSELTELYKKVKTLFPDSKITINDNDTV